MCKSIKYTCAILCLFFFQAEDGIRDLVRSRGLGDVYKRQLRTLASQIKEHTLTHLADYLEVFERNAQANGATAVSYTHLTLPTSDLV